MEFNYFDVIVGSIVLLLGLKGIINGFFKELFGLIGIVGGIFVASRFSEPVGTFVSDLIFKFDSSSAIDFTGFVISLALFWALMLVLGATFTKLSAISGLGPVDKFFGFVVGSGKFFLIAAVIAYAIFNIKAVANQLEPMMQKSILLPILVETGGYIMKIDPTSMSKQVSDSVKSATDSVQDSVSQEAKKQAIKIKSEVEAQLKGSK
ncbi:MAG: CvpA family protein [Helicobacteraceae bacterium]|nr:CvpA family protein [Helicobacteraceae bacterium]